MSEQDLVAAILQYLYLIGAVAVRINAGMQVIDDDAGNRHVMRGAPAGTSDILACYKGTFLAIECKIGKNKPTQLQENFLQRVGEAGGIGLVAYSIDDVQAVTHAIDKRPNHTHYTTDR